MSLMISTPPSSNPGSNSAVGPSVGAVGNFDFTANSQFQSRFQQVVREMQNLPSLRRVLAGPMRHRSFFVSALALTDDRGYGVLHHCAGNNAAVTTRFLHDLALYLHPNLGSQNMQALLDRRENTNGFTPLHCGVHNGATETVRLLIELGASPSLPCFEGQSPLHMAVQNNDAEMVNLLLEAGADPNATNLEGATALHIAAASGFTDLVVLLLRNGAFWQIKDDDGEEPLFWAVRESRHAAVKALLNAMGSDPRTLVNEDGESPVDICEEVGDHAMSRLLMSMSANNATATTKTTTTATGGWAPARSFGTSDRFAFSGSSSFGFGGAVTPAGDAMDLDGQM